MPMVMPIAAGAAQARQAAGRVTSGGNVTGSGSLPGGGAPATVHTHVGSGGNGRAGGSASAGVAASIGGSGARGVPAVPGLRAITESLGDQTISAASATGRPGFTPTGQRIGRNDPCWCGSGNKYKKCHGR
jgi:preprotein translocase subunit SecA